MILTCTRGFVSAIATRKVRRRVMDPKYETDRVPQVSNWPVWNLASGPDTPNNIQREHFIGTNCRCANTLANGATMNLIEKTQCDSKCGGSRESLLRRFARPLTCDRRIRILRRV